MPREIPDLSGFKVDFSAAEKAHASRVARHKEERLALLKLQSRIPDKMEQAICILEGIQDISGGTLIELAYLQKELAADGHGDIAQKLGHSCSAA